MEDTLQDDVTYLKQLGATKDVIDVLGSTKFSDFYVIPTPFSELTQNIKACSFVASFGGNTVTFTLRKTLSDKEWWIDETAVIGDATFDEHSLFRLNVLEHAERAFTYALVSPYEYDPDGREADKLLAIANCSILVRC